MPKHAVIRCDASPRIGGGHATRCLALAQALQQAGWRVTFAVSLETCAAVPWLPRSGIDLVELAEPADGEARALCERVAQGCDALIVDHYDRGREWESSMRGWARRILVIDDGTGRAHDCDVLVDSGARGQSDYAPLLPPRVVLLLGPQFALLRKGFMQHRAAALARHLAAGPVRKILVSFGSTDPWNATSATLDAIEGLLPETVTTIVLSSQAPHLAAVRARLGAATRLVLDIDDMPALMSEADIGIGAAGATSFERAILGLPALSARLVDNQDGIHRLLIAQGAALDLGGLDADYASRMRTGLAELAGDAQARATMAARASGLVDGRGAERIVECLEA